MSILAMTRDQLFLPNAEKIARCLIFIGLLCLMFYVPILNRCCVAASFLMMVLMTRQKIWYHTLNNKVMLVSVLLLILFTAGVFYGPASWHYSLRGLDKYFKVAYLIFFIPLFYEKNTRNYAFAAFLSGVMINEIVTYLHYFNILNFGFPASKHWLFVQDIDSGFIVSFAAFICAHNALRAFKERVGNRQNYKITCYMICYLILSIDVLILNQERTGYLIYLALAGLFLLQQYRWKGFFSAMILVPILFGGLYLTSNKFNDRVNQIYSNISEYQKGNQVTSIGLRLAFAEYSFKVIKAHPVFGIGTGSFNETYKILNGPKLDDNTWPSHPHNEYIAFLFQWGLVGLLIFCTWLYQLLKASFILPTAEKFCFQGLLLGFVLLGFCNASLLVNPAGSCFIILSAVLLASAKSLPTWGKKRGH